MLRQAGHHFWDDPIGHFEAASYQRGLSEVEAGARYAKSRINSWRDFLSEWLVLEFCCDSRHSAHCSGFTLSRRRTLSHSGRAVSYRIDRVSCSPTQCAGRGHQRARSFRIGAADVIHKPPIVRPLSVLAAYFGFDRARRRKVKLGSEPAKLRLGEGNITTIQTSQIANDC